MEKIKKSKNHFIDKLHKILDNRSPKELPPKDEKYLLSLKRRITSPFNNGFKKSYIGDKTVQVDENDPLKPKVEIHPRERFFIKKELEFKEKEIPKPIEEKKIPDNGIELCIENEELFEVEKTTMEGPEFIQIKPIDSSKEKKGTFADENLKEWESVEKEEKKSIESPIEFQDIKREVFTEPEKTSIKQEEIKKIEIQTKFCPKCGARLSGEGSFCGTCGQKLISETEEKRVEGSYKEIIELEPIEIEKPDEKKEITTWEPIEESDEQTETIEDIEQMIEAFKELKIIDSQTAKILYNNGITNIEILKNTPNKNLTKIKGLKRKTIKQIQKELKKQEKTKFRKKIEEEPIPTWEPVEIQKQDTVMTEEDVSIWEPIEEKPKIKPKKEKKQKKIKKQVTEPKEEFFIEEDVEEVILFEEEKEDIFADIRSIDEKISDLLIKNNIDTLQKLEEKTIKELTKIKGIRKKVAKEIKREVKEHMDKKTSNELTMEEKKQILREAGESEKHEDEWEYYDEEKITEEKLEEIKGFRHKDYTLFEKTIKVPSGKIRIVRFFSKAQPEDSEPIELPKGYVVKVNKKTGVPYLKKKK